MLRKILLIAVSAVVVLYMVTLPVFASERGDNYHSPLSQDNNSSVCTPILIIIGILGALSIFEAGKDRDEQ